jgi:5-methylcytosine-specific restriction endonuclease McrA
MNPYSLGHLTDAALRVALRSAVRDTHAATALMLAHIAEFDARQLYLPAAHPSMKSYLVHEFGFGEQAALKRLRAARAAREFPAILIAIAEGRLTLTAVVVLATHLTAERAPELIAAAEGKSIGELERALCARPRETELPLIASTLATTCDDSSVSSRTLEATQTSAVVVAGSDSVAATEFEPAPVPEERFEFRFKISREAHDLMRYARSLLGHAVPSGDPGVIFERAMIALVRQLEKQKFAATDRPRRGRGSKSPRHVPAAIKRAVLERDQGRCSFVSEDGKRCPACTLLEYDHVTGVARGGTATVDQIRLRCRAHNQYAAELMYGKAFMQHKREQAQAAAAKRRAATAPTGAPAEAFASRPRPDTVVMTVEATSEEDEEIVDWLRLFGYSAEEARAALKEYAPRRGALPGTQRLQCLLALRSRKEPTSPAAA